MISITMLNPKVEIVRNLMGGLSTVTLQKDYDTVILYFESAEDFERSFRIPEKNEEVKVGGTD